MNQVWQDYVEEAKQWRIKEYGYDVLNAQEVHLRTEARRLAAHLEDDPCPLEDGCAGKAFPAQPLGFG